MCPNQAHLLGVRGRTDFYTGPNFLRPMTTSNPFDALYFRGPWRKAHFGDHREQQIFMSVGQWFEAARFDERIHPELVQEILLTARVSDAHRIARRNQKDWRTDWPVIRSKVLLQGLWLCFLHSPDENVWTLSAAEFADALVAHGIEDRYVKDMAELFLAQRAAPKVLVLGAASAPPKEVGKRINALHKRLAERWVLVHWMGRHTCWNVHDWADSRRMPILPVGDVETRLARDWIPRLLSHCDQALVFERRGGKSMDKVIKAFRAAGKPIDIALWTDDTVAQIPGASLVMPGVTAPAQRAHPNLPMDDLFGGT